MKVTEETTTTTKKKQQKKKTKKNSRVEKNYSPGIGKAKLLMARLN